MYALTALFSIIFQDESYVEKLVMTCAASTWEWEPNLILPDYSCKHSKLPLS